MWFSAELLYLVLWMSSGDEEVIRKDGLVGDETQRGREYGTVKVTRPDVARVDSR